MHVSVVIPVYNEEETLPFLKKAVDEALKEVDFSWQAILVNDGSKDKSWDLMREIATNDPIHYKSILLRRNFGQTAAIAAGIDHADGDVIVLMDADLQNDPLDIPMLVDKINEGYDVVSGWRYNRQDNVLRKLPSHLANGLISWVTGVHLHDYGCTLKAYRREVLTGFRLYGEMHRFIPVYANTVGARLLEVRVNHHARKFGKANYGLERTFKVILDLFTVKFLNQYSNKPIYLFGGTGIVMMLISLAALFYLFVRRVFFEISILGSPIFQMSTMVFILGFQSILMGLIAELLVRTYHESQNKRTYTIREIVDGNES
ncbi:MAG: glycosyltransferase family 2 protein [Anaerolineaceae bacterium]|nr:glycosyltransferase family 2 protein [Anaerolineaceae bacterium]